MEKVFIWARMIDIGHEIDSLINRVKRMRGYPRPRTEKIMIRRSGRVVQIGFQLFWLRSEVLKLNAKINYINAQRSFGGVTVQDASDALCYALINLKSSDEKIITDPVDFPDPSISNRDA